MYSKVGFRAKIKTLTTSSERIKKFFSSARLPISLNSSSENTFPIGLCGVFRIRTFVFGVHAALSSSISSFHSDEETFE